MSSVSKKKLRLTCGKKPEANEVRWLQEQMVWVTLAVRTRHPPRSHDIVASSKKRQEDVYILGRVQQKGVNIIVESFVVEISFKIIRSDKGLLYSY